MSNTWRNISFVLGAACAWQAWRGCHAPSTKVETTACTEEQARPHEHGSFDDPSRDDKRANETDAPPTTDKGGISFAGFKAPPWVRTMLPQHGENLRAYRDRMIPIAQMAIAPQRERLQRSADDFAKLAKLDDGQKAALDANVDETATAIEDRLFTAALSGDLSPATFKPMAGVKVARDVLDIVDQGNTKFVGSLHDDQRATLATHPFDFADYLVFHTKWEDAISGL
ncbi:MAG TPA: hypothetical protein VGM39_24075 [Kofleriaceae bacterium]|jgi:hypothetical protein